MASNTFQGLSKLAREHFMKSVRDMEVFFGYKFQDCIPKEIRPTDDWWEWDLNMIRCVLAYGRWYEKNEWTDIGGFHNDLMQAVRNYEALGNQDTVLTVHAINTYTGYQEGMKALQSLTGKRKRSEEEEEEEDEDEEEDSEEHIHQHVGKYLKSENFLGNEAYQNTVDNATPGYSSTKPHRRRPLGVDEWKRPQNKGKRVKFADFAETVSPPRAEPDDESFESSELGVGSGSDMEMPNVHAQKEEAAATHQSNNSEEELDEDLLALADAVAEEDSEIDLLTFHPQRQTTTARHANTEQLVDTSSAAVDANVTRQLAAGTFFDLNSPTQAGPSTPQALSASAPAAGQGTTSSKWSEEFYKLLDRPASLIAAPRFVHAAPVLVPSPLRQVMCRSPSPGSPDLQPVSPVLQPVSPVPLPATPTPQPSLQDLLQHLIVPAHQVPVLPPVLPVVPKLDAVTAPPIPPTQPVATGINMAWIMQELDAADRRLDEEKARLRRLREYIAGFQGPARATSDTGTQTEPAAVPAVVETTPNPTAMVDAAMQSEPIAEPMPEAAPPAPSASDAKQSETRVASTSPESVRETKPAVAPPVAGPPRGIPRVTPEPDVVSTHKELEPSPEPEAGPSVARTLRPRRRVTPEPAIEDAPEPAPVPPTPGRRGVKRKAAALPDPEITRRTNPPRAKRPKRA